MNTFFDPIVNMSFVNTDSGIVLKIIRNSGKSGYVTFNGISGSVKNAVVLNETDTNNKTQFPYTFPVQL